MTTSVKVHVNGPYKATVMQDNKDPVVIHGGEEKSFTMPHPANSTFVITEEADEPDEDAIPAA